MARGGDYWWREEMTGMCGRDGDCVGGGRYWRCEGGFVVLESVVF